MGPMGPMYGELLSGWVRRWQNDIVVACLREGTEVKGATSRILHLEKAGKYFFQVCHS